MDAAGIGKTGPQHGLRWVAGVSVAGGASLFHHQAPARGGIARDRRRELARVLFIRRALLETQHLPGGQLLGPVALCLRAVPDRQRHRHQPLFGGIDAHAIFAAGGEVAPEHPAPPAVLPRAFSLYTVGGLRGERAETFGGKRLRGSVGAPQPQRHGRARISHADIGRPHAGPVLHRPLHRRRVRERADAARFLHRGIGPLEPQRQFFRAVQRARGHGSGFGDLARQTHRVLRIDADRRCRRDLPRGIVRIERQRSGSLLGENRAVVTLRQRRGRGGRLGRARFAVIVRIQLEHLLMAVGDEQVHQLRFLATAFFLALLLQQLQHFRHARTQKPDEEGIWNAALARYPALRVVFGRRKRRNVINVGLRVVLGVERQRPFSLFDKLVEWSAPVIQIADETNAPHALLRAGRRQTLFDPRITEDALLGLLGDGVEVDLLVRAGGDAMLVTAAALLVDEHDAVFLALVNRLARTGGETGRIGAMVADARQIKIVVVGILARALVLVPVGAVDGWHDGFQLRPLVVGAGGVLVHGYATQCLIVVEFERRAAVPVQIRDAAGFEVAGIIEAAAGLLPAAGVSVARVGFDVVPVHVLAAVAVGPLGLAGRGAGLAADALVELHHHRDLAPRHGCRPPSSPRPPWIRRRAGYRPIRRRT